MISNASRKLAEQGDAIEGLHSPEITGFRQVGFYLHSKTSSPFSSVITARSLCVKVMQIPATRPFRRGYLLNQLYGRPTGSELLAANEVHDERVLNELCQEEFLSHAVLAVCILHTYTYLNDFIFSRYLAGNCD